MPRRLIARLGLALALVLVLGSTSAVVPNATAAVDPSVGSVSVPDQRFLRGCHTYRANYRVRVATEDWSAFVQVFSPNGVKAVHALIDRGPDTPRVGQVTFTLCRASWRTGRWKAVLKVIYEVGDDLRRGQSRPNYFRLYR